MKLDQRNNDIDDKSHILKEVDQKSIINQAKVEVNNGYMNEFLQVAFKPLEGQNFDKNDGKEKDLKSTSENNKKVAIQENVQTNVSNLSNKKMCRICNKQFAQTHIAAHIRKDHEG